MVSLSLPPSTINAVIDDPTIVTKAGTIPEAFRATILAGYVSGFRTLFILNAAFAGVATIAGIVMIKHKELRRPDELKYLLDKKNKESGGDIELGDTPLHTDVIPSALSQPTLNTAATETQS
jgi:hypothetical protein